MKNMVLRIMRINKTEETRASEIVKKMIESIDLLTGLIAQLPAQEFASRRLGKLLQNLNMPGIFIICHALLTKVDQLLGCDLSLKPAFKGNIGYDRFAPVSVWHTHHTGFTHGRMLVKDILYLAWPHFEPRSNNHILLTVNQVKPALFVHSGNITSI